MKKLLAVPAALIAFALNSHAQDTSPPTITMSAPVNGVAVFTDRITVTGTATDDVGVRRVEYRLEGNRRWRAAILANPNETTTTYVFSFTNRKKGRARRVYVRARDEARNESDTIGRRIVRSRFDSASTTTATATATRTTTTTGSVSNSIALARQQGIRVQAARVR